MLEMLHLSSASFMHTPRGPSGYERDGKVMRTNVDDV